MEGIKLILDAANSSLENALQIICYLASRNDFQAFNEVYGEYFRTQRPSRTAVGVGDFVAPGTLVEITVVPGIPG